MWFFWSPKGVATAGAQAGGVEGVWQCRMCFIEIEFVVASLNKVEQLYS